jgi:hypothetical protein
MTVRKPRLGLELALALSLLLIGAVALPVVIFLVGSRLFGAYGAGPSVTTFYGNFVGDLVTAKPAAWAIVLGPLLLAYLVRAILGSFSFSSKEPDEPSKSKRVEPAFRS